MIYDLFNRQALIDARAEISALKHDSEASRKRLEAAEAFEKRATAASEAATALNAKTRTLAAELVKTAEGELAVAAIKALVVIVDPKPVAAATAQLEADRSNYQSALNLQMQAASQTNIYNPYSSGLGAFGSLAQNLLSGGWR